jgi:hypothetical protein
MLSSAKKLASDFVRFNDLVEQLITLICEVNMAL